MQTPSEKEANGNDTRNHDQMQRNNSRECNQSPQPMEIDNHQSESEKEETSNIILDATLKDETIKSMGVEELCFIYSAYLAENGIPIDGEILKLWKPNLLRTNITLQRDKLRESLKNLE